MSPALRFVLLVGVMSFFVDFTYEGSRSVIGQYLALLDAGALVISVVSGLGELLGYGLRLLREDRENRFVLTRFSQRVTGCPTSSSYAI